MIVFPLVVFFGLDQMTSNTLVSGGLAAVTANVVLIGYLIVAFTEKIEPSEKEKKND